MTIQTARLVDLVEGEFTITDFPIERLIASMEVRGFAFTKLNDNLAQRPELQG